jgi:hypothetical protein
MFFAALLIVKLRLSFAHAGNQGEIHRGNLVEKFFQVEAFAGKMVNRDISWITCCDHGYGRPSWRPRVSAPATYRSGKETNPAVSRDGCQVARPPRLSEQARDGGQARLSSLRSLRFRLRKSFDETSRSVPQAGSQFRGLATAIHEIFGLGVEKKDERVHNLIEAPCPAIAGLKRDRESSECREVILL